MPQPAGMYHLKLACYRDDTLITESEIGVLSGFTAAIYNTRYGQRGGIAFCGLMLIAAPDPQDACVRLKPAELTIPEPVLDAAQHYSFSGLRLSVYCPGANRFEAEASWSKLGPLEPSPIPSTGTMITDLPESEWTYLGRLSAALDTPDLEFVHLGNFWQPYEYPSGKEASKGGGFASPSK